MAESHIGAMTGMQRVQSLRYLGVPVKTWEVWECGPNRKRTLYTHWLAKAVGQPVEHPAGTITARTVTGNPRRGNFRELVAKHVVPRNASTGVIVEPDTPAVDLDNSEDD